MGIIMDNDVVIQEEKNIILICECSSAEHQLIFRQREITKRELEENYAEYLHTEELDEIFIDVHLTNRRLFSRIKYAIKYIFGYKSRFGAFDEIITSKTKLRKIVNQLN